MSRRGTLQRSLIALLVLLMVTPTVLLRPCCCVRGAIETANLETAQSGKHEEGNPSSLPPCCLKRLQAARKAQAAEKVASTPRSGVHDAGRCACRNETIVARTNRSVFKTLIDNQVAEQTAVRSDSLVSSLAATPHVLSVAESPPPISGAEHCAHLCRWLI